MTETSTAPDARPIDPAVEAALVASREARIESLLELARIPSVSALHEHAATWSRPPSGSRTALRGLGATEVEVIATDLHPIVYGRIHEAPGAPTVIVYCHYDVQPVDPLDLWEHPPFEPFVRDGRFIGRGVSDDKGQLVMHLERPRGAARGRPGAGGQPDLRVRGRGGVRLGEPRGVDPRAPRPARGRRRRHQRHRVLRGQPAGDHRRPPRASCTPRSTSSCRRSTSTPACTAATVHNPANALATIVAALKGPDGRIRIPGFYDDVVALTDAEREAMAGAPVRRRGVPRRDPRARAGGRGRLDDARAARRPPDPRRQRDVERVPGRGRQDHHPGPCPREDLGAAGGRPATRADLRGVPRPRGVGRAGRRHGDDALPPRGAAEPDAVGPPGDDGRRPGASRPSTASSPSSSARAARSPSPRCSSTTSACRSSCSGSRSRPATRTRPTSGSWSRTSSAARASSCGCGTSSRRRPGSGCVRQSGLRTGTPGSTFGPSHGIGSGGCAPKTRC